jgi:hypothetical protein
MNGYSSLSLLISRKRFFDRLLLSIIFLLSMAVGILLVHAYWQQKNG